MSEVRYISLGESCTVKYQLARNLFFAHHPNAELETFRASVFDPTQRGPGFDTQIFDWQITPLSAVNKYIETDFKGIFEKADLTLTGDSNYVKNIRLGTFHPHLFHPPPLAVNVLEEGYAEARAKIDYLIPKFRRLLKDSAPSIFF